MGLSIVVSGVIILTVLILVLYSIPSLLDIILSVEDVSSEVFDLEQSIFETNIFIDSLSATSGSPTLTFNLKNVGNEKLWNYDEFDLFVTYDADISGTKTRVTEIIPFGRGFSILSEITLTSADTTATSSYTVINGMTDTVTIDGTGSHIIFSTSVTFDSDSSDSGCRAALFIDGSNVAEAQAGVDSDSNEPGHVGLVWVDTGLSAGSHIFDVRWLEEATGCIIATDTQRHMQVVEFTSSDVTISILANDTSTSSDTSITGSYDVIDNLVETVTTTAGGVQMITTSVSWIDSGTSDAECDIAIFIDGSIVAETRTATDAVLEGGNANLVWWESGLGGGPHTFDIRAKENQANCNTDTQVQRHMQVVEFSGTDAPTILSEVTGTPSQNFMSSYEVVTGMTTTPTIDSTGSLVFISGSVSFVTTSSDSSCWMGIHRGGTMLTEGQTYQDASDEGRGVSLLWAETGISGSHTYDLRAKEGQTDCAADTSPTIQQHMQVVEFLCAKEWKIVGITNDVSDPRILNTDETAQICVTLNNPIFSNGNVIVSMGTDNGVVTTSALTVA